MKWKSNKEIWYSNKERVRTFFAIIPITINGETRWMEKVTVRQKYFESDVSPIGEYFSGYWDNVEFLSLKEPDKENLHNEFYELRNKVWNALDNLVRTGCDYIGELPCNELPDGTSIYGIKSNPNYNILDTKSKEKDISVKTNLFEVYIDTERINTLIVTPNLNELQYLSTYVSGGYAAYD